MMAADGVLEPTISVREYSSIMSARSGGGGGASLSQKADTAVAREGAVVVLALRRG